MREVRCCGGAGEIEEVEPARNGVGERALRRCPVGGRADRHPPWLSGGARWPSY